MHWLLCISGKEYKNDLDLHKFLINKNFPRLSKQNRLEKSAGKCDLSKDRADPSTDSQPRKYEKKKLFCFEIIIKMWVFSGCLTQCNSEFSKRNFLSPKWWKNGTTSNHWEGSSFSMPIKKPEQQRKWAWKLIWKLIWPGHTFQGISQNISYDHKIRSSWNHA